MKPDLTTLDGLITPEIGRALAALAHRVPAHQAIVEIGSYRGASTAWLASAAAAPVFAVDPWELRPVAEWCHWCEQPTRAQWQAQLAAVGLLDRVTPLQGLSVDMAAVYPGPPVGLLFVDGDHAEDAVVADVTAWAPHLAGRATVVFDDYGTRTNPGVAAAVARLHKEGLLAPGVHLTARRLAVCRVG